MAQANTRISGSAQERLGELKAALRAEFGLQASYGDIASALIHGTTVPQSAGMLIAYTKDTAEDEDQADAERA
jgi:hypothetical protein